MAKFENMELAEWLEDAARVLLESNPKHIALAAKLPDGEVLTGYLNTNNEDKAVLAHHIFEDAMLDMLKANIGVLRDALEETEEEDG